MKKFPNMPKREHKANARDLVIFRGEVLKYVPDEAFKPVVRGMAQASGIPYRILLSQVKTYFRRQSQQ